MALLLRKDVQKASYYVWFLGAEESRGLRGSRILMSAIPYVVDRSHEIDPIKVTLQVSHKGMKIVQGSSKHFISHSAITCSVQTDDVVACILLLYNPMTKCPLHIHVYRCDSESTAQALNQQLQVLINRPENQKRFAELEARLGLLSNSQTARNSLPPVPSSNKTAPAKEITKSHHRSSQEDRPPVPPPTNKKHFDSSLGSDTGTSTRESDEGSEERTSVDMSPAQATIFDSLAAELREKLNGNGPPLLLPPRDYDTVHRSKGNLAAIELRRCQQRAIVGTPTTNTTKYGVSSRGSSGIGSDLAPSPERQEAHSSSDDDWLLKKRESEAKIKKQSAPIPARPEKPPSYLYPLQKQAYVIPTTKSSKRGQFEESDNEQNVSPPPLPQKEEEIKPKLVRPRNLDAHFKQILEKTFDMSDEKDNDEDQQFSNEERFFKNDSVKYKADRSLEKSKKIASGSGKQVHRTKSAPTPDPDELVEDHRYRYRESSKSGHKSNDAKYRERDNHFEDHEIDDRLDYTENLTDKQKYRQSLMKKQQTTQSSGRYYDDGFRAKGSMSPPPPPAKGNRHDPPIKSKGKPYYEADERTIDSKKYRHKNHNYDDVDFERNPYKEPESLPYRESVECMIKSPVMRYKSYDDSEYRDQECDEDCMSDDREYPAPHQYPGKYRGMYEPNERSNLRQRYRDMKADSKESFHHSKEKLKQVDRSYVVEKPPSNPLRRMGAIPRHEQFESNKVHRHMPPRQNTMLDWSSEDEQFGQSTSPLPSNVRIIPREHYEKNGRMVPSKSLGNLVKGYRHSYAEPPPPPLPPHAQMPRNSGRVGLAAVNPY